MREIRSRRHTGSTWVTRGGSPWAAIDSLDEGGGLGTDRARPGDDPRGRPLEVALMGLRHMGRIGRVPAAHDAADMGGHALALPRRKLIPTCYWVRFTHT